MGWYENERTKRVAARNAAWKQCPKCHQLTLYYAPEIFRRGA